MVLRKYFAENIEASDRLEPLPVEECDDVGFPCRNGAYFVVFKRDYGIFNGKQWDDLTEKERALYPYFVTLAERRHREWLRERLLKDKENNRVFSYISAHTPHGYTARLSEDLLQMIRFKDVAYIYHFVYNPQAVTDVSISGKPLASLS